MTHRPYQELQTLLHFKEVVQVVQVDTTCVEAPNNFVSHLYFCNWSGECPTSLRNQFPKAIGNWIVTAVKSCTQSPSRTEARKWDNVGKARATLQNTSKF